MTEHLTLRRWGDNDRLIAVRSNSPELMTYLGGPETPEKVESRSARYADGWRTGAGSMFVIMTDEPAVDGGVPGEPGAVGVIGYWPVEHNGESVLEAGWTVFVSGRGFATQALRLLLSYAATHSDRPAVHAFSRIDHEASSALCRRVGFDLLGPVDIEYPPGNPMRSNDWRYDLQSLREIEGRLGR